MAENLITLDEVTNFAPDLDMSAFSSTTISGMITRASEMIRRYCNVDGFLKTAVTEKGRARINPAGELTISFARRPVAESDVTGIRLKQVDINIDLELQDGANNIFHVIDGRILYYPSTFIVLHGNGLLSLRNSNLFYEVDYSGGYDGVTNVPEDLKEAVTLMLRHLANRRFNSMGARSFSQGDYSVNFGDSKGTNDIFMSEATNILDLGGYVRRVID